MHLKYSECNKIMSIRKKLMVKRCVHMNSWFKYHFVALNLKKNLYVKLDGLLFKQNILINLYYSYLILCILKPIFSYCKLGLPFFVY